MSAALDAAARVAAIRARPDEIREAVSKWVDASELAAHPLSGVTGRKATRAAYVVFDATMTALTADLAWLLARVERLEADATRLDWLQSLNGEFSIGGPHPASGDWFVYTDDEDGNEVNGGGKTLREAIDAAHDAMPREVTP